MRRARVSKFLWLLHPESTSIFIGTREDIERESLLVELGPAWLFNKDELRMLFKEDLKKFSVSYEVPGEQRESLDVEFYSLVRIDGGVVKPLVPFTASKEAVIRYRPESPGVWLIIQYNKSDREDGVSSMSLDFDRATKLYRWHAGRKQWIKLIG